MQARRHEPDQEIQSLCPRSAESACRGRTEVSADDALSRPRPLHALRPDCYQVSAIVQTRDSERVNESRGVLRLSIVAWTLAFICSLAPISRMSAQCTAWNCFQSPSRYAASAD